MFALSALTAGIGSQQGGWNGLGNVVLGVAGAVISVPVVVRGLVLASTYSEAQEQQAIEAWQ